MILFFGGGGRIFEQSCLTFSNFWHNFIIFFTFFFFPLHLAPPLKRRPGHLPLLPPLDTPLATILQSYNPTILRCNYFLHQKKEKVQLCHKVVALLNRSIVVSLSDYSRNTALLHSFNSSTLHIELVTILSAFILLFCFPCHYVWFLVDLQLLILVLFQIK